MKSYFTDEFFEKHRRADGTLDLPAIYRGSHPGSPPVELFLEFFKTLEELRPVKSRQVAVFAVVIFDEMIALTNAISNDIAKYTNTMTQRIDELERKKSDRHTH